MIDLAVVMDLVDMIVEVDGLTIDLFKMFLELNLAELDRSDLESIVLLRCVDLYKYLLMIINKFKWVKSWWLFFQ